jgi:hypothetical protein
VVKPRKVDCRGGDDKASPSRNDASSGGKVHTIRRAAMTLAEGECVRTIRRGRAMTLAVGDSVYHKERKVKAKDSCSWILGSSFACPRMTGERKGSNAQG